MSVDKIVDIKAIRDHIWAIQESLETIADYSLQWIKALLTVVFAPLFIVWEMLKVMIHPIIWSWTFFQCAFIIDYYIRKKYFNLEYNTLLRYNITLNYPSRQADTLRNRIYRWCTFKIFERNNWAFDPNRKASWQE